MKTVAATDTGILLSFPLVKSLSPGLSPELKANCLGTLMHGLASAVRPGHGRRPLKMWVDVGVCGSSCLAQVRERGGPGRRKALPEEVGLPALRGCLLG